MSNSLGDQKVQQHLRKATVSPSPAVSIPKLIVVSVFASTKRMVSIPSPHAISTPKFKTLPMTTSYTIRMAFIERSLTCASVVYNGRSTFRTISHLRVHQAYTMGRACTERSLSLTRASGSDLDCRSPNVGVRSLERGAVDNADRLHTHSTATATQCT